VKYTEEQEAWKSTKLHHHKLIIGNSPETLTFASNNPYKKLSMLSSAKEQGSGMSKLFNT